MFDGPKRPRTKRGQTRAGSASGYTDECRTKQLIRVLGFEIHDAPGEAEAECAVLQKSGVVDAVLSEDVDTLMFGSGLTLRDWSAEGGGKVPSHVTVHDAEKTRKGRSGLNKEGMILVALMSGGDYDTDGIPRCGVKVACEAARAGFGRQLCRLRKDDEEGFTEWRKRLVHELYTNESKFFRQKSKAIIIPEGFPNREILGYYTHPVVSSNSEVRALEEKLKWNKAPNVAALRAYVEDVFQWTGRIGAKKMIRGLAPAMLAYQLRERDNRRKSTHGDILLTQANEMEFVRCITGERIHESTGGELELRVTYQPSSIVPWDLDSEVDNEIPGEGAGGVEDGSNDGYGSDSEPRARARSPTKRNLEIYDPTALEKVWIARSIVRVGVPLKVEDYEEAKMEKEMSKSPKKPRTKTAVAKPKAKTGTGMQPGALNRYFATSKPLQPVLEKETSAPREPRKEDRSQPELPPVFLRPMLEKDPRLRSPSPRDTSPTPPPREGKPRSSSQPLPEVERNSQRRREWKAPPRESSPTPPLLPPRRERAPAAALIIEASQPSPGVRPRREHWKVKPPSRTNTAQKTTSRTSLLQAYNTCKSSKSGSCIIKCKSGSFANSSFSAADPYKILDSSPETGKGTNKHPRQPTPPTPTRRTITSSPVKAYNLPLPGISTPTAKKRAPLARARTIAAEPSDEDDDELPSLGRVFRNSPHAKRTLERVQSDSTTIKGSPSMLGRNEEGGAAEVIDLLSSPIQQPDFSRNGKGREEEKPNATLNCNENVPNEKNGKGEEKEEKRCSFSANFGKHKRFLAPRGSLPGAWKEFTEEEIEAQARSGNRDRRRFYRMSGVQVVDLSEE